MKPILFNTEMVRAILDGRKTTTRRIVHKKYSNTDLTMFTNKYGTRLIEQQNDAPGPVEFIDDDGVKRNRCNLVACEECKPPYRTGDILYVRETWCERLGDISRGKYIYKAHAGSLDEIHQYALDQNKWRPSIHMPREAARIFLRVSDVRAERLRDITEGGVSREGHPFSKIAGDKLDDFALLWNGTVKKCDLNKYGWNANPWVWVYEFERCEKP